MAVVPEPSRIRLPSGSLWRCAVSLDPNTSMPNIHISMWHGICYVHEAWAMGSIGTCYALLLPTYHIYTVGCSYSEVSHTYCILQHVRCQFYQIFSKLTL